MTGKVLSISSSLMNEYIYEIVDNLTVKVKITKNDFHIPPQLLFQMAARINKKRSFLFVSKVLGKHLPINPETPILASSLLAAKYMREILHISDDQLSLKRNRFVESIIQHPKSMFEKKPFHLADKTIFIGFAETATALGHGVFENFQNAFFYHTTREKVDNKSSIIDFEEEHSHATSHYCYIDSCHIDNQNPIVLIDDELTTGNTVLNIIQSIQSKFPRRSYTILTLLDWRNEGSIQQFVEIERKLGIKINIVSLISGEIEVDYKYEELIEEPTNHLSNLIGKITHIDLSSLIESKSPYYHLSSKANYLWETGRFGLDSSKNEEIERFVSRIAQRLSPFRSGGKTLCLGNGELMYLPMKIASFMGDEVYFQSTTRSPIYVSNAKEYLINSKYSFPCPVHAPIVNYFYQIEPNMYDEVFIFYEREHAETEIAPLMNQLIGLFPNVYVVTLSKGKDEVDA